MKFINIAKSVAALAIFSAAFTSCEQVEDANEVFGAGRTIVKLIDAGPVDDPGIKKYAIDFVSTPTTIIGADVRRDVPNATELSRSMVVTVKDDTAAVTLAGLTHLDPSWYTVGAETPKTGGVGGTYTVNLAPGEFAKPINIIITDATLLDPSETYGLGFTIMTADANGVISALRTVVIEIGAKNKYDGRYEMRSLHHRPPYNGFPFTAEMHMVTVGASTVRFYWPDAGAFGHPIGTAAGVSWYGGVISPAVTFDPVTNLVTNVFNMGSTTIPNILATPPAAPVSRYDEATRTMYVYWYYTTGAGQDFTNRGWSDTLVYIGPR